MVFDGVVVGLELIVVFLKFLVDKVFVFLFVKIFLLIFI